MATIPNTTQPSTGFAARPVVPPLEPGDVLTAEEFERRWDAMPDLRRAELIDGVVYMNAAVSVHHGSPHAKLGGLLFNYASATPGTQVLIEPSVKFDRANLPQPDVVLMTKPEFGGQGRIEGDYLVSSPELVAEISATTASRDLHAKLDVYRRFGVREYVVWRTYDEAMDWFVLRNEQYEPLVPSASGRFESTVYPGLWLDADALLRDEMLTVLKILQEGIATPEHAVFAQRFAAARSAHQ